MKIAIPTAGGKLCMHFGHCEKFVLVEVEEKSKTITGKEDMVPPPHEPGILPKWLHEKGANVIIAGSWIYGKLISQVSQTGRDSFGNNASDIHRSVQLQPFVLDELQNNSKRCLCS